MISIEIKSRKVRKILKLEEKAAKLQARYDAKHDRIVGLRMRAASLRLNILALEATLTGSQLGELRRIRDGNGKGKGNNLC